MSSAIDEIDLVCGRQIDRHEAPAPIRHGDFAYYFDRQQCAEKFRREPERYATVLRDEAWGRLDRKV